MGRPEVLGGAQKTGGIVIANQHSSLRLSLYSGPD